MPTKLQLHLAKVFLKIFLRDRQSIFFSILFPVILMTILGLSENREQEAIDIGIANNAGNSLADDFIASLAGNPLFNIISDSEQSLLLQIEEGEISVALVLPAEFSPSSSGTELKLLVDASQIQALGITMPALEQALITVEREFNNSEAMFSLNIVDVQARSQRYLDFLLPGLLAFTLMQIAIAGSGFNIVEYRRKGILKRLFVTPILPRDFIISIVIARLALCLMQLSVLLFVAVLFLKVSILGSYFSFYLFIILGTVIFLCLGFCLGSIAKTQQSIMAIGNLVIFPQILLSGIFYSIESMPGFIQPIASILPLSFVATGMRDIANNGYTLFEAMPSLIGVLVWLVLSFVIATRLFVWKEVAN
ncbi:MAG: ABC transporter permease [SAR86 cluster bacterium]|uniref:ABC transporter permease n=1 Tax=SAR86 cluster bacterium TaxID=2030880 RepID=A0A2A4MU02_9GAMM|nr:MAG: ABC transporter permease [SAR86 cluster bacterium]